MKCSIIIPAWNRAYIIKDALESAAAQTYGDLEILVIDDGSTDDTRPVVEAFRDARVRYIRHAVNKGCSAAYNTGFREAQGGLISFLDSDDLWSTDKLEADVDFLERNADAAAVFSDLTKEDGSILVPSFMRETPYFSKLLRAKGHPSEIVFGQREMHLCLLREVPVKPTTLTIRREVLGEVGFFNESWPSGSDWEFLLRFSRLYRFGYIDRCLGTLRVQSDATHRIHAVTDKSLMLSLLRGYMVDSGSDREVFEAAKWGYTDIAKHLAWKYLDNGQNFAAARTLAKACWITGDAGMLARSLFSLLPQGFRAGARKRRRPRLRGPDTTESSTKVRSQRQLH